MKIHQLLLALFLPLGLLAQTNVNCDSTFKDTDGVTIHFCADKMPEFLGGDTSVAAYFNRHIKYPPLAAETYTRGHMHLWCIIMEDGSLKYVSVTSRVIGPGSKECIAEAVRVANTMPKWKPGMINGKPVRVLIPIHVRFMLPDKPAIKDSVKSIEIKRW